MILVKLDDPSSSIYGGKAAAPVSKTVLQAAIAARDASLDRGDLAAVPRTGGARPRRFPAASRAPTPIVRVTESGSVPYVYRLDSPRKRGARGRSPRARCPTCAACPVRRAVYALHRAGFRVSLASADAAGAASAHDAARGRARAGRHDRPTACARREAGAPRASSRTRSRAPVSS